MTFYKLKLTRPRVELIHVLLSVFPFDNDNGKPYEYMSKENEQEIKYVLKKMSVDSFLVDNSYHMIDLSYNDCTVLLKCLKELLISLADDKKETIKRFADFDDDINNPDLASMFEAELFDSLYQRGLEIIYEIRIQDLTELNEKLLSQKKLEDNRITPSA